MKVSKRSRDLLRRGRTRTFHAKAKQTPVSGAATSTKGSFKGSASRFEVIAGRISAACGRA